MEDELRKLPLRSVPNDYADRVMRHIAQAHAASARRSNALIAAQIAATGGIALLTAWGQSTEVISVLDAVVENLGVTIFTLEQFIVGVASALNDFRIEPLEGIAAPEGLMMGAVAGILWLLANGLLIVNVQKEKLA